MLRDTGINGVMMVKTGQVDPSTLTGIDLYRKVIMVNSYLIQVSVARMYVGTPAFTGRQGHAWVRRRRIFSGRA